jgi:deoxyhypusine synthase
VCGSKDQNATNKFVSFLVSFMKEGFPKILTFMITKTHINKPINTQHNVQHVIMDTLKLVYFCLQNRKNVDKKLQRLAAKPNF